MPRLRPSVGIRVVGAGALIAASLLGNPAAAQSANGDDTLLSPNVQGDPRRPQMFRRTPPATARTLPAPPVGQIADYGYRPALGAGSTGFDSTNDARRRTRARRTGAVPARATQTAPPASEPVPAVQNGVVPAVAPAQRPPRRGAVVTSEPDPGPLATPRLRPPSEQDPFAPTGIRAGAFLLRPAVELSAGYNSNPSAVPAGAASSVYVIAPELLVRSDWSRHELTAALRGSYTGYGESFVPDIKRPSADMRVDGRIDVGGLSHANVEARLLLGTDNPGSPNLQAGLAKLPIYTTFGTSAGYTQVFNRFEIAGTGTVDRTTYQDSLLTDGTTASNADRAFDQYGAQFRAGYELIPGVKPFVGLDLDRRVHDLSVDRSGFDRDSRAWTPRVGTSFAFSSKLSGDVSLGYLSRTYDDPSLPKVQGPTADASLVWMASALTTATLTAKTTVGESTLPGVSGSFTHDYQLQIDHSFRRWLLATLRLGYGTDSYVGLDRFDRRYFASAALVYKLSREVQLKSELRQDRLQSNVSGVDYTASAILFGVRLQR